MDFSWREKVCGTSLAKKRMPEDRRVLPEEEGDLIREHMAMHHLTKDLSRQVAGRFRVRWIRPQKVGAFNDQEEVGKAFAGRSNEIGAGGDRQQLAK